MAELQTIAAVFDLLKVTYEAVKFLKKVKDADKIAAEIAERIKRLENVLEGVQAVLKSRDDHDVFSRSDAQVAERIRESVLSCTRTLTELQTRVGGFDSDRQNLLDRIRVALRSPSISRINNELEARISILSTDLTVLQLFDQTKTSSTIDNNHDEVLRALSHLGAQVQNGHQLLSQLMHEYRELALQVERRASTSDTANDVTDNLSEDAIGSLTECLRAAEDVHDRYTSEYLPDDRSDRVKRAFADDSDSPFTIATPSIAIATPSTGQMAMPASAAPVPVLSDDEDYDEDVWPLDILNMHIGAYADRAGKERDSGHFQQAESNLSHAIRNSETREAHYGIPFVDRSVMQEEMAFLYKQQRKWAEAVTTVHQLLRERSSSAGSNAESEPAESLGLDQARQNQLLASIYFDRHATNTGGALSHTTPDIEEAEKYARRAFNRRWKILGRADRSPQEVEQHNECIRLLVRILETRDKTVEANVMMGKLISDGSSNESSSSMRRTSTNYNRHLPDFDVVDKHDILVEAIRSGDSEQIQTLLAAKDLDLERFCKQGKTFLMHAVEMSDESTVHKLLDPEVGANVDTPNRRGMTALHYAAMSGLHDMARCLLHHDAEIEPRDRKGEAPVTKAVLAGDVTMVQIFFDKDENTLQTKGGDEWSLLHYAVQKPRREMIGLLLDLAPELKDAVDKAAKTPLHYCAEFEKLEQATALLEHRHHSDVNTTDSVSRTALYLAATKPPTPHRESMVRLLLRYGATVDERRPPPRMRDYTALRKSVPRRDSTLSRTSVSTEGTVDTASTGVSRFSRLLSGRMGMR